MSYSRCSTKVLRLQFSDLKATGLSIICFSCFNIRMETNESLSKGKAVICCMVRNWILYQCDGRGHKVFALLVLNCSSVPGTAYD